MKFNDAIVLYLRDMKSEGRITSPRTERSYNDILYAHSKDLGNRDPRTAGREDVKRTLTRWPNPNTQRTRRAVLCSFYDWCMEEGYRKDNPARQTRRPRKRPTSVYRLTRDEAALILRAATGTVERRAIYLGVCAGLRNSELRGLQGRHFRRPGFIWVSGDIAKGQRERWVPVIGDLAPVIAEIAANVADTEYVLPGQKVATVTPKLSYRWVADRPMGGATIWRMVGDVAKRAGIVAHVHPHLLRHAYGDYIAKSTGLYNAKELLGHADVSTTQGYVDRPTLEELATAVQNVTFLGAFGYPPSGIAESPVVETAGIEPALSPHLAIERILNGLAPRIAVYAQAFTDPRRSR